MHWNTLFINTGNYLEINRFLKKVRNFPLSFFIPLCCGNSMLIKRILTSIDFCFVQQSHWKLIFHIDVTKASISVLYFALSVEPGFSFRSLDIWCTWYKVQQYRIYKVAMCVCHRHTRTCTCTYTLICVWEREGQIHHYTMKITSIIHSHFLCWWFFEWKKCFKKWFKRAFSKCFKEQRCFKKTLLTEMISVFLVSKHNFIRNVE